MKRLTLCLLLALAGVFLAPGSTSAQTNSSDQILKDLLTEVRSLREDLRRLTTSTYRAHAIIERFKLQQEQVNRLNSEVLTVRNDLAVAKNSRGQLKEKIAIAQERVDNGTGPTSDLVALKAMLTDLEQREPDLVLKESQLSSQLNFERTNLEELQKKLDAIDVELQSLNKDDNRPKEKP